MSVGREESKRLDITVSSGTGTGTIAAIWAIARRLRIVPPNESATFTVAIKDAEGSLIIQRTSQLGTMSELQYLSLGIARTVEITNASTDGTYAAKFDMH